MTRPNTGSSVKTIASVVRATPFERFDNAVSKLFSVPKDAFLREQAKLKRRREKKWSAKKV
jgi:hypothetical protein